MKALNFSQTLEVERSRYLSRRHLPQETFPVGPVHSAFEKDVTYIFLHKLRASFFFFFPFLLGYSKQAFVFSLLSAPELEWTSEELFMGRMLIT